MSSSLSFLLGASAPEFDLLVIDFSKLPQPMDGDELRHLQDHPMLAKVREACTEWGFFRLVNHGISEELLDNVQNVNRCLFSMSTEAKERARTSSPVDSYHRAPNYETFNLDEPSKSESLNQLCSKIWPEGNLSFRETMAMYSWCVTNLAHNITKIILISLGLDANAFYRSHFENCTSRLRINGYSSHLKSVGEETMVSHTDLGVLTILYQDDSGGLQIRSKEGKWLNVKPLSHSFVVNLGDSLKAWSNGRCRSAEHRVVCEGWVDRMSIAFFTLFPVETEIWTPAELVDVNNPRRYKPFIFSQFREKIRSNKEVGERATALQRFAGVSYLGF